jgi:Uma2 family endonuclease
MARVPETRPFLLTYEDYRAIPDDGRRYELIEGEIRILPGPTTDHQRISRNLGFLLHQHVLDHGLGEILSSPIDVILDRGTVVQPDVLFVSTQRSGMISKRGIEGPPDLVVEILSDGTESFDRGAKRQIYLRYGVTHYWIVDPDARLLAEYVRSGNDYELRATHASPSVCRATLFPELELDLSRVFPQAGSS